MKRQALCALFCQPYFKDAVKHFYNTDGNIQHFILREDGTAVMMVHPAIVAWHHGGNFQGKSVNQISIGVALEGKHSDKPFQSQMESLVTLLRNLKEEYQIKFIFGRQQLKICKAPGRRVDWDLLREHSLSNVYDKAKVIAPDWRDFWGEHEIPGYLTDFP
mmetsp:Transcript_80/g.186  ORF Transcript_80/g.186 Transcript_80/m.186 type:complete len:161 (-) Transcript_80:272-754(-)